MLHFWQNFLNPFLNSTFLVSLVTLIIGIAAYSIYRKRKDDFKRDAANTILLEIESAEQQLQKINEIISSPQNSDPVAPGLYLMPNSSWDKFRYLFVRDFDRNEWDKVSDFYNKCQKFDEAVSYNESLFDKNVNEIRKNLQSILANYADGHAKNLIDKTVDEKTKLEEQYIKKRREFIGVYGNTHPDYTYLYYPSQPVNAAKAVLGSIETNLSLTSVGIKLKRLLSDSSVAKKIKSKLFSSSKPPRI